MELKEYEAHITDHITSVQMGGDCAVAYCGIMIQGFAYVDASHAIADRQRNGRMLPCPKCRDKIIELLKRT